jgi:hypothetical protein
VLGSLDHGPNIDINKIQIPVPLSSPGEIPMIEIK